MKIVDTMVRKTRHKRIFAKGEKYRPIVTVEKTKKNVPTVIMVSGRRYIYEPGDKWR